MYKDNDFIYEAIASLEETLKMPMIIESLRDGSDAILNFNNETFYCLAKKNIKNASGVLISISREIEKKNKIIITDYLSRKASQDLKENNINYIDIAGNAFIKTKNMFVYVEGKKTKNSRKTNKIKIFQEAGLKLLLLLLSNPKALEFSYRELAKKANISLGSVSNVFTELEENNYLLRTKSKRVLKNREEIIERWVVAYNEILKPRSFRKRMRAINGDFYINYTQKDSDLNLYFGGEPGGDILTEYLKPKDYTIYTNEEISRIAKELKLVPDEFGNIEIYSKFWADDVLSKKDNVAPSLVVYADLLGTGNSRNIETAKIILENGL